MLEKIGLPAKPSMRGASWVIDASHCQGCSSQFTFINRKHHCRRCGGLFCGSCTQQRTVLRGQGDSPVRICDPCKKLEDAARFELRYGYKNRAAKGNLKQGQKSEEEILGQILNPDGKQPLLSEQESQTDMISDVLRTASSASSSSLKEEFAPPGKEGAALCDIGSNSPEELRQQAMEEKKKYKILKGEGKAEEALQAFKRGKELERQAGALELALRKQRRIATQNSNLSSAVETQKIDDSDDGSSKRKPAPRRGKEEKGDLADELRELGWSDADLHDTEKKPVKLSLEGELSSLLKEIPQKSSRSKTGGIDKSQVVALKKKALLFKRAGKLAEAKEELKRAKVLEKQLEEQELLGEDEDSDDELSALIRSMDDDKQDDLLLDHAPVPGINFDHFVGEPDDLVFDGNFDVTDDDMNDPDLAAALKSFGWTEEDDEHATSDVMDSIPVERETLQGEVLTLKREALSQKRAGNVAEAMSLLKKAKLLEKDLENMQSDAQTFTPESISSSPTSQILGDENRVMKLPPKSKIAIQKELLALKKKALALRREGRLEEADEELKKGKVLELQLEEMENAAKRPTAKAGMKTLESNFTPVGDPGTLDLGNEVEAEVTEQDMHDPSLMSVLKNLGWNDDDAESVSMTQKVHDSVPSVLPRRSKAEIQRELLGLKRKALALRRQGKTEEADEELERAKDLEKQLADMEAFSSAKPTVFESHSSGAMTAQVKPDILLKTDGLLSPLPLSRPSKDEEIKGDDKTESPAVNSSVSVSEGMGFNWNSFEKPVPQAVEGSAKSVSNLPQSVSLDSFIDSGSRIFHSPIEKAPQENTSHANNFSPPNIPIQPKTQIRAEVNTRNENETAHTLLTPELKLENGVDAQRDEILARKRKAVAFKREGKLAEAREELRQAKLLEKSLEDRHQQADAGNRVALPVTSDATTSVVEERRPSQQAQKPMSGRDRFKLQQESLSHKRNALKLRREGKIAESEAEFELAKALESQLEEFGTQGSSTSGPAGKMGGIDDMGVEDLLDPQLMSALKSIGWEDSDMAAQPSQKSGPKLNVDKGGKPQGERAHLEEMIKAEKMRALHLKRDGKQAEALEALRAAKRLEKKLGSLT